VCGRGRVYAGHDDVGRAGVSVDICECVSLSVCLLGSLSLACAVLALALARPRTRAALSRRACVCVARAPPGGHHLLQASQGAISSAAGQATGWRKERAEEVFFGLALVDDDVGVGRVGLVVLPGRGGLPPAVWLACPSPCPSAQRRTPWRRTGRQERACLLGCARPPARPSQAARRERRTTSTSTAGAPSFRPGGSASPSARKRRLPKGARMARTLLSDEEESGRRIRTGMMK